MAASIQPYFGLRKVLPLCSVFLLFTSALVSAFSISQPQREGFPEGRRFLLNAGDGGSKVLKAKSNATSLSKLHPPKNPKPSPNSTKAGTPVTQLKKLNLPSSTKTQLKKLNLTSPTKARSSFLTGKLNSTSNSKVLEKAKLKKPTPASRSSDAAKPGPFPRKHRLDLVEPAAANNKTSKPAAPKQIQGNYKKTKIPVAEKKSAAREREKPRWIDGEEEDDWIPDFSGIPYKFQQTFLPDLEKISTTSKAYLTRANVEITRGFEPIVGNQYAPVIASVVSFVFILIPLLLVSLLCNRIKAYFSLQMILLFVNAYLWIYFSILCLSSLVTGLDPLRLLYTSSQPTYVCVQALQALGYVLYLLLLLLYLVLVFSAGRGMGSRLLGLAQTAVGYAVGLHYYVAVFHRAVLHQPPRTSGSVYGIYATCFFVICLLARAERGKRAYVEAGGGEGKKN